MKQTSFISISLVLAAARRLPSRLTAATTAATAAWRPARSYRGPAADRPFPLGPGDRLLLGDAADQRRGGRLHLLRPRVPRQTRPNWLPARKKHLEQVALRLEHVPFPVVIEESPHNARPELDQARRQTIVEQLGRLGLANVEERVVVANAFPEGYTGIEAEGAYYNRPRQRLRRRRRPPLRRLRRRVSVGRSNSRRPMPRPSNSRRTRRHRWIAHRAMIGGCGSCGSAAWRHADRIGCAGCHRGMQAASLDAICPRPGHDRARLPGDSRSTGRRGNRAPSHEVYQDVASQRSKSADDEDRKSAHRRCLRGRNHERAGELGQGPQGL